MFRNLLLDKIATTLTSSIEVENGASANSAPGLSLLWRLRFR